MSKARTLERLAAAAGRPFIVDSFTAFSVSEWQRDRALVLGRIRAAKLGATVVVRSSAVGEDEDVTIPPGIFHSSLNVDRSDELALVAAIEGVVASYQRHAEVYGRLGENEVMVQAQVCDPSLSGIALAAVQGGYIHVDYDDESGVTNSVTAGRSSKSLEIVSDRALPLPEPWAAIRDTVFSVSNIIGVDELMIEFAVAPDGLVHVFQARRQPNSGSAMSVSAMQVLKEAVGKVTEVATTWSDMTDWNPAELLGDRAQPLAISLYQFLVTDNAWVEGRSSLGYRAVEPSRLVETIAEKAYVNVRTSFLSLTPALLSRSLAERLVADRLEHLQANPALHDKAETEVVFSTADVVDPSRTAVLRDRGFLSKDVSEIDRRLRELTVSMVSSQRRWAKSDADLESHLTDRLSTEADAGALARSVVGNLERCRDKGAVPFARHARLAFVARDVLGRLRTVGAIDPEWETRWWAGHRTVVHDVVEAISAVASGTLDRRTFNQRVGHLRARTFDILSPRYDQLAIVPRPLSVDRTPLVDNVDVDLITESVTETFRRRGLGIDGREFLRFARESTQLRERFKFSLSRVLSRALEDIARIGEMCGLSRNDVAFCSLQDIRDLALQPFSWHRRREHLAEVAAIRRVQWADAQSLVLPGIIFDRDDLLLIQARIGQPNFITDLSCEAGVALVQADWNAGDSSLDGKIAVIEAADPGYDWIFAFRLAGLVTKYGGATSHMAIRCAQLQIPAAIGCGEELFRRTLNSKRVRLDCRAKAITTIVQGEGDARD